MERCAPHDNIGRTVSLRNRVQAKQMPGSQAPRVTKAKAVDLANKIRMKERGGLSQVITLDQGVNDDNTKFWSTLGGKGEVASRATEEEGQIFVRLIRYDHVPFGELEYNDVVSYHNSQHWSKEDAPCATNQVGS